MKSTTPLILMMALQSTVGAGTYINYIRQTQLQAGGTVWDMPVAIQGTAESVLKIQRSGSTFQLWTVEQTAAKSYLLDQKLVSAYLPTAAIKVTTLDPYKRVPRTRVDKPFTVLLNVLGLVSWGANNGKEQSKVLLQRYLAQYPKDGSTLDTQAVISGTPFSSVNITTNGDTVLNFPASSLTAADPTKVSGEEFFVARILPGQGFPISQVATASVQVWPIASGAIKGVLPNALVRFQMPTIELALNDLYPLSNTYFVLYQGASVNPAAGTIVTSYPLEGESSESRVITVPGDAFSFPTDGTYTVALMSDTVYGRELLCAPVTFTFNSSINVNAMQVNYSNGENP